MNRRRAKQLIASGVALATGIIGIAVPASASEPATGSSTSALSSQLGSMYSVVDQIGARTLWEQGITGDGVTVAVIDSGILPVPTLDDQIIAVADFSDEAGEADSRYLDGYGHGTHMAGIIAGRDVNADPATAAANDEWFLGVAPDADLVAIKAGNAEGGIDPLQIVAGIDWAIEFRDELGIDIINLSFSSSSLLPYFTDPLTHAVERAWDAGIVVVVAAGNTGRNITGLTSPANDPYVISVGGLAAQPDGTFTAPDWTSEGDIERIPDFAAPGELIISARAPGSMIDQVFPEAVQNDHLTRGSGSSQASAVTSGAVALLLDARPDLTPDEVKQLLISTADSSSVIGDADAVGAGLLRVDLAAAATPNNANQWYLLSTGTGVLNELRGVASSGGGGLLGGLLGGISDLLAGITGIDLALGELLTDAWDAGYTGTRWTGTRWTGTRWTDGEWLGTRWTEASWTGTRWTSDDWAGTRWTGTRWTGTRWTSSDWTGTRWTGTRWTGTRWTSDDWSSAGWG